MTVEAAEHGHGGVRVLSAAGEIDAAVAPAMLERVAGWVRGARAVALDLTSVQFFDSSGLRLVDRLARECGRAGVALRVVVPPGSPARRVLEVTGMLGPQVTADLGAALAELGAGG